MRLINFRDVAIAYLDTQVKEKTYLGPDGTFVTDEEYPKFVRQELFVNAVAHRLCKALHKRCYAKLIVMQSYCRIHWFYRKSGSFYFA